MVQQSIDIAKRPHIIVSVLLMQNMVDTIDKR